MASEANMPAKGSLPKTMRAWQYTNHSRRDNGIEHNLTLDTVTFPTPNKNQHLVKIISVGLNPADYKRFEGVLGTVLYWANKSKIPGLEASGRIIAPAPGTDFKEGDLIYGLTTVSPFGGQGPLSEYAVMEKAYAMRAPQKGLETISDAAGIVVAGITAYQSVTNFWHKNATMRQGGKIFINGGSGGTGLMAIQIAKLQGLHVTATCSKESEALVRSVGADDVIDYRAVGKGIVEMLRVKGPFDKVVDNAGHNWDLYWRAHEYTTSSAVYVMVAGGWLSHILTSLRASWTPGWLGGGKTALVNYFPDPKIEDVEQVATWISEEKVRVVIDARFEFEDTPKAFAKLKTGRAKGKILVDVD